MTAFSGSFGCGGIGQWYHRIRSSCDEFGNFCLLRRFTHSLVELFFDNLTYLKVIALSVNLQFTCRIMGPTR
ncbi:MAG TPA: hypothetical protein EYG79_00920 [Rhodobacteraceae bacterium]|nr:hypothetical protein [Paracoccaceae bacterium]